MPAIAEAPQEPGQGIDLLSAAAYAARVADWTTVVDLLVDQGGLVQLLDEGSPEVLLALRHVPPAALHALPDLRLVCAAGRLVAGDPADAEALLSTLTWGSTLLAGHRRAILDVSALALLGAVAQARGDAPVLVDVAQQACALLSAPHCFATAVGLPLRALVLQQLGTGLTWQGSTEKAVKTLLQGLDCAREAHLFGLQVQCLGSLARIALYHGQLSVAERYGRALDPTGPAGRSLAGRPDSFALHLSDAYIKLHRADFAAAADSLRQAEAVLPSFSSVVPRAMLNCAEARLELARGNIAAASELVDTAPSFAAPGLLIEELRAAFHARVLVAMDEPLAALDSLARLEAQDDLGEPTLARAVALLAAHREEDADVCTEGLRSVAMTARPLVAVEAWLVAACARGGDAAADALRHALILARGDRIRLPFIELAPHLQRVLLANPSLAVRVNELVAGHDATVVGGSRLGVVDSTTAPTGVSPAPRAALTDREYDVLMLLTSLSTTEEIARSLYVTPNTVKTHLKSLFRKLGVNTRREAVRAAASLGILHVAGDQGTPESDHVSNN